MQVKWLIYTANLITEKGLWKVIHPQVTKKQFNLICLFFSKVWVQFDYYFLKELIILFSKDDQKSN